jgi:hypothetical protein
MDGRVLTELLEPATSVSATAPVLEPAFAAAPAGGTCVPPLEFAYTEDEDAEIQQRLADLGYL